MTKAEKEIKDIQTLNIEEVQELRDYYLKTATLFSSRSRIGTAHIYYALARECLKHKRKLENEAYEKDYSKEKLTEEEIEKIKAIMNSNSSDDNSEESDITENK